MIDFNKLRFGQSLPPKGWRLARIHGFDEWASSADATKHGIKAVLRLVNDSYCKDIAILDEEIVSPGGPIYSMLEVARGDVLIDHGNELPEKLFRDAVGQELYVNIDHNRAGMKVFPRVTGMQSVCEYRERHPVSCNTEAGTAGVQAAGDRVADAGDNDAGRNNNGSGCPNPQAIDDFFIEGQKLAVGHEKGPGHDRTASHSNAGADAVNR